MRGPLLVLILVALPSFVRCEGQSVLVLGDCTLTNSKGEQRISSSCQIDNEQSSAGPGGGNPDNSRIDALEAELLALKRHLGLMPPPSFPPPTVPSPSSPPACTTPYQFANCGQGHALGCPSGTYQLDSSGTRWQTRCSMRDDGGWTLIGYIGSTFKTRNRMASYTDWPAQSDTRSSSETFLWQPPLGDLQLTGGAAMEAIKCASSDPESVDASCDGKWVHTTSTCDASCLSGIRQSWGYNGHSANKPACAVGNTLNTGSSTTHCNGCAHAGRQCLNRAHDSWPGHSPHPPASMVGLTVAASRVLAVQRWSNWARQRAGVAGRHARLRKLLGRTRKLLQRLGWHWRLSEWRFKRLLFWHAVGALIDHGQRCEPIFAGLARWRLRLRCFPRSQLNFSERWKAPQVGLLACTSAHARASQT